MQVHTSQISTAQGRVDEEDDAYFQSEIAGKQKERPRHKFPCCCLSWEKNTWYGIGTIFSGMMIQASLGIASIWGNIVVYVTSKLRGHDPELSL